MSYRPLAQNLGAAGYFSARDSINSSLEAYACSHSSSYNSYEPYGFGSHCISSVLRSLPAATRAMDHQGGAPPDAAMTWQERADDDRSALDAEVDDAARRLEMVGRGPGLRTRP